jgi:hypothetical protein
MTIGEHDSAAQSAGSSGGASGNSGSNSNSGGSNANNADPPAHLQDDVRHELCAMVISNLFSSKVLLLDRYFDHVTVLLLPSVMWLQ